ncbi:MAG TPA: erythromycin esterase family protein, partial [Pyrinomonadaceae bacterium]
MHTATLNSILTIIFFATTLAPFDLNAQQTITRSTKLATNIKTGESHEYRLNLNRGESAEVVVGQRGVDVIVELRSPAGRILDVIDGPTGRTGDEIVEIIAAERGNYVLIVRPFGRGAASGDYELEVRALRGARETEQMLQTRRGSRDAATAWLRPRSTAIPPTGLIARNRRIPSLDALARSSRVIGLGEATHGSREINDLRFSVSRYLIEHHGYRVIAIEASAATLELLAPYVNGDAELTPDISRSMESEIWIGKRIRGEVYRWAREWNKRHSRDRVRVIGVDPQGSAAPLRTLRDFLERAYGDELVKRWTPVEIELAAADQQTFVFGYSGVSTTTRQFLMHIVAMFDIDAPILRSRFGDEAVESAINAARILAEFSDFNSDSSGVISHSRD